MVLKELKNWYPYIELVLGRWYQQEMVFSRQTALDLQFIPVCPWSSLPLQQR